MYQAARRERLRLQCWEDECVVYNDVSGDTHLLCGTPACVLRFLSSRERASREELEQACSGTDAGPTLRPSLDEALEHLIRLRLCEVYRP